MLDDQVFNEYGGVIPTTRDELLEEWRHDPSAVIQQSEEFEGTLDGFLTERAGPSEESPGSTSEWLLYNEGIRMVDTFNVPSTRMSNLPDIEERANDPVAHLMNAYWDERYQEALFTGERAANSLAPIESNTVWRPIREEMPFRQPQIAPAFDFRKILAFARQIPEDQFRLNRMTNAKGEQMMQVIAEGTEPQLFELTRSKDLWEMESFRAGIEATDSFLNDPQVRAADITNAVEEIAIGHRIVLLRKAAKLITGTTALSDFPAASATSRNYTQTGDIAGVSSSAGKVSYAHFSDFVTHFGTAYKPDCVIGNEKSIVAFKLMSVTEGDNLTLGSWAMLPNSSVEDFNGDMLSLGYGWIDDPSTNQVDTGLTNEFRLFAFQKATTIGFVQRMGMDQDEIERVPGPRKVRRWLGTESLFCRIDPNGVGQYNFNS